MPYLLQMIAKWKEIYHKLPRSLKLFMLKSISFFILWQLLYHFVMIPTRVPDSTITNITGIVIKELYSFFYHDVTIQLNTYKVIISIGNNKLVGIADPCNALEIYVLYIAFIVCYPSTTKLRVIYILAGLPVLFLFNIIRICIIATLYLKNVPWTDISHHYIFTSVMYLIVFLLWVMFTKKSNIQNG